MFQDFLTKGKGSTLAPVSLCIAALLVLAAAGWSFVQKGCHSYFQREATAFFNKIEEKEIGYKGVHNRYLSFAVDKSGEGLRELKLNPREAEYYDFSVMETDRQTFRVTAHLKPEILKRWYLHHPKSQFTLVYEKKEGERGRLLAGS